MQGIPENDLWGPTEQESYLMAKKMLVRQLQETYIPPEIHRTERSIEAYRRLNSKNARLLFSEELLISGDEHPFDMEFCGSAHLPEPDIVLPVQAFIPPNITSEHINKLDKPDRKAIAIRHVGRSYAEIGMMLADNGLLIDDDLRSAMEEEREALLEFYHRLVG